MADIKNKNELRRRTEMFLDEFSHEEYKSNEEFCKETMRMMREFISRACQLVDDKVKQIKKLQKELKEYKDSKEVWHIITEDTDSYPPVFEYVLVEDDCGDRNVACCDADCEWSISNGENSLPLIGDVVKWMKIR